MAIRIRKKTVLILILVLVAAGFLALYICDRAVENSTRSKIYSELDSVPYNRVGLLLGTGKYLKTGNINPYYHYRIQAATNLIRAGKIRYLIISGDNSRVGYDEPTDMKSDLVNAGIDSTVIFLDYAGFRTFDSVIRSKEIFGQDSLTIISQAFHNQRAIFIASKENIYAVGFNAKDLSLKHGFKTQAREKFARVKLFVDFILGNSPKFLGPKVKIPE